MDEFEISSVIISVRGARRGGGESCFETLRSRLVEEWRDGLVPLVFQSCADDATGNNDGAGEELRRIAKKSVDGEFRGIVVFAIGRELADDFVYKLRWRPSDSLVAAAAYHFPRGGGDPFGASGGIDLDHAFGVAHLICRSGGAAVFVVEGGDEAVFRGECFPNSNECRNAAREAFFKVVSLCRLLEDPAAAAQFMKSLVSRRLYGFGRARLGWSTPEDSAMEKGAIPFGPWEFCPKQEFDHWLEAEITRRSFRFAFERRLATLTGEGLALHDIFHAVLAAARVATFLAFEKNEVVPFRSTILMVGGKGGQDPLKQISGFRVISPPRRLFLTFDDWRAVAHFLRGAQDGNLVLVADLASGEVKGIYEIPPALEKNDQAVECRQENLARLVDKVHGVVIFCGMHGLVEVHAHSRPRTNRSAGHEASILLYCDGPEWRKPPGPDLVKALSEIWPGKRIKYRKRLEAALLGLLERDCSVIVAVFGKASGVEKLLRDAADLPQDERVIYLREKGIEEMDSGIGIEPVSIENLGTGSLRSLLAKDGAHILGRDGHIIALGLRILGGGKESEKGGGTGLAAVLAMRENKKLFGGALIVKVSAGGAIHCIRVGD